MNQSCRTTVTRETRQHRHSVTLHWCLVRLEPEHPTLYMRTLGLGSPTTHFALWAYACLCLPYSCLCGVQRPHGRPLPARLRPVAATLRASALPPGTRTATALRGSVAAQVQLQGALKPPELVEDDLVLRRERVDLLTLHAQLLIHAPVRASLRPVPQRCAVYATVARLCCACRGCTVGAELYVPSPL